MLLLLLPPLLPLLLYQPMAPKGGVGCQWPLFTTMHCGPLTMESYVALDCPEAAKEGVAAQVETEHDKHATHKATAAATAARELRSCYVRHSLDHKAATRKCGRRHTLIVGHGEVANDCTSCTAKRHHCRHICTRACQANVGQQLAPNPHVYTHQPTVCILEIPPAFQPGQLRVASLHLLAACAHTGAQFVTPGSRAVLFTL
jgi:hypothetical protein